MKHAPENFTVEVVYKDEARNTQHWTCTVTVPVERRSHSISVAEEEGEALFFEEHPHLTASNLLRIEAHIQ